MHCSSELMSDKYTIMLHEEFTPEQFLKNDISKLSIPNSMGIIPRNQLYLFDIKIIQRINS